MQNNTRSARRRAAIRTTVLCCAVLILAAIVTLWAQRTFWPEGILARMLPYMSLLYILLIHPLLRRTDGLPGKAEHAGRPGSFGADE